MMTGTRRTLGHGHRRQISTPTSYEATTSAHMMNAIAQSHGHRRGQTVDHGSSNIHVDFGQQKSVTELRDYFEALPASPAPMAKTVQHQNYIPQAGQTFVSSAQLSARPSHIQMPGSAMGSECQAFNQEQLQAIQAPASGSNSPPVDAASSLSRTNSRYPGSSSQKFPLDYFFQSQDLIGSEDWELFPQQNLAMAQNDHSTGYHRSLHQVSAQPEISPDKSHAYIPNPQNFPITPCRTPSKRSFDYSMYSNDQTPTKSHSFSVSRTPGAIEMQRAQSLHGVSTASAVQMKHQMLSPDNSPSTMHAELAAMPSPGSCRITPQKTANSPATPSTGKRQRNPASTASSPVQLELDPGEESAEDVDLDARVKASVQETGISSVEIAKYISGPDPADGKWVCQYRQCHCRFGRKENIKSHVQTHLGDRQYKCDMCQKPFVRGHDLKRHLKTHSGKKPFACDCGASFARQDALTRHRQRDMCIGGFAGFVPKTTKRGRPPKKNRPDMETRQTKAAHTRQRAATKAASVSPIKVEGPVPQDAPVFTSPNYTPSKLMPSSTPPTSPGCSARNHPSPGQSSGPFSPEFEDDMLPLSSPQIAHSKYERAISHYDPNIVPEPFSQDCLYNDPAISPHDMSSPHTAPTLAESVSSEIDVFMTQDPSEDLHGFGSLANHGLAEFPTSYQFLAPVELTTMPSFFSEKTFAGLTALDEDPLSDSIDTLSSEFLVDP